MKAIYAAHGRQVDIAGHFNVPSYIVRDIKKGRSYADILERP